MWNDTIKFIHILYDLINTVEQENRETKAQ